MAHGEISKAATNSGLGALRKEFRPDTANLVAGFIIGCLLLIGGVALVTFMGIEVSRVGAKMPLFAEQGMSWATAALLGLLGCGVFVGGIATIKWARRHISHRVGVHENGVAYSFHNRRDEIPWTAVQSFRENIVWERAPVLKGAAANLIPKKASHNYAIQRSDGVEFIFNPNTVKDLSTLASILRREAEAREIAWLVHEQE